MRHGLPLRDERFCKIMKRSVSKVLRLSAVMTHMSCGLAAYGANRPKSKKTFQNTLIFNVICGKILPYRMAPLDNQRAAGKFFVSLSKVRAHSSLSAKNSVTAWRKNSADSPCDVFSEVPASERPG